MFKVEEAKGKKVVLDASICGQIGLWDYIRECMEQGGRFIITSITFSELEKLQKKKLRGTESADAGKLLDSIKKYKDNFEYALISEVHSNPDEDIIQFCVQNKGSMMLWTSDKVMAIRARMFQVKTVYMKRMPACDFKERDAFGYSKKKKVDLSALQDMDIPDPPEYHYICDLDPVEEKKRIKRIYEDIISGKEKLENLPGIDLLLVNQMMMREIEERKGSSG